MVFSLNLIILISQYLPAHRGGGTLGGLNLTPHLIKVFRINVLVPKVLLQLNHQHQDVP